MLFPPTKLFLSHEEARDRVPGHLEMMTGLASPPFISVYLGAFPDDRSPTAYSTRFRIVVCGRSTSPKKTFSSRGERLAPPYAPPVPLHALHRWYPCVVDSCVPFFVLRSFIIRLSCTRTGEGHRCARGSGCIPASMFAKCKWPTRSGKRKKRKERKRRRRRKGGGKKRGAPQRGRLIGGGHCPRIWPWGRGSVFRLLFTFARIGSRDEHVLTKRYGGLSTSRIGEMGNANC